MHTYRYSMRSLPVQEPRQPGRVGIGHGAGKYLSAYHEESSTLSCWWCLRHSGHALYACADCCWSGAPLQPGSQAHRFVSSVHALRVHRVVVGNMERQLCRASNKDVAKTVIAPYLANSPAALSVYVWQNTRCICSARHCRQYFEPRSLKTFSTWLQIAARVALALVVF